MFKTPKQEYAAELKELAVKRVHSTLGNKSPIRFLGDWISVQHEQNWQYEPRPLEDKKQGEA